MPIEQTKLVVEQFSKQAVPFANADVVRNDDVLNRILGHLDLQPDDLYLDVACGPGLLVCAFAPFIHYATGIDLTPAMLTQAKDLQSRKNLENVCWLQGDVNTLPFADGTFSVVTSRYAFHHMTAPGCVLREMVRVCKPGGRILVVDSCPHESKAEEFNRIERLRDPSHVRALTEVELQKLFAEESIEPRVLEKFRLSGELESLLSRSFPLKGSEKKIREAFESALRDDVFDFAPARGPNNEIHYSFPITLIKAIKPPSRVG